MRCFSFFVHVHVFSPVTWSVVMVVMYRVGKDHLDFITVWFLSVWLC